MREIFTIILLFTTTLFLTSCKCNWEWGGKCVGNYSNYADEEFKSLEYPITIIAKDDAFGGWNVTVRDNKGYVTTFGNLSNIAGTLGDSYNVGDIIK